MVIFTEVTENKCIIERLLHDIDLFAIPVPDMAGGPSK